jgi:hypothetical protein
MKHDYYVVCAHGGPRGLREVAFFNLFPGWMAAAKYLIFIIRILLQASDRTKVRFMAIGAG